MAPTKKRIRDITRLLRRDNLDTETRNKLNAEIEELQKIHDNNVRCVKERQHSLKYHRIKFFDRKKALRQYSKILKSCNGSITPDVTEKLCSIKEDLAYILYFPKTMKYASLFVSGEGEDSEKSIKYKQLARKLSIEAWKADVENGQDLVENLIISGSEVDHEHDGSDEKISRKRKIVTPPSAVNETVADDAVNNIAVEVSSSKSSKKQKKEEKEETLTKPKSGKRQNVDVAPSAKESNVTVDPFFQEEILVPESTLSNPDDMKDGKLNPKRSHKGKYLRTVDKTGRPLTKQEMRMQEWKRKQKEKHQI